MQSIVIEPKKHGSDKVTRPDFESAERINEAIKLGQFCGTAMAALYMDAHCIAPSIILRTLMTKNRRQ